MLDIVNEHDEVIGADTRENIHEKGLFHREIAIWVVNDKGETVLQKRAMTKKSHPGLWSLATAGHVESGESYLFTAVRELEEETGIIAKENELIEIEKCFVGGDVIKDGNNNHFLVIYAYKFKNEIDNLSLEKNEADEIKWFSIDKILNADDVFKKQFVPHFFNDLIQGTLKKVKQLSLDSK